MKPGFNVLIRDFSLIIELYVLLQMLLLLLLLLLLLSVLLGVRGEDINAAVRELLGFVSNVLVSELLEAAHATSGSPPAFAISAISLDVISRLVATTSLSADPETIIYVLRLLKNASIDMTGSE